MTSIIEIILHSILSVLIGLKCSQYIYRYYFHPLRQIPGPWYMAISAIPTGYLRVTGRYNRYTNRLHDIYGPVIRTGPNMITTTDPKASKLIYTNSKFEKSSLTKLIQAISGKNLFTIIDRHEHSQRRRMVSHAFSQVHLDEMQPVVWHEGVVQLIAKLETKCANGQVVNFLEEFNYLTVDIIGQLAFGQKFDMIRDEKSNLMDAIQNAQMIQVLYVTIPFLKNRKIPFMKKQYNAMVYMNQFCKNAITQKKESHMHVQDIMYHYLNAIDPQTGEALTEDEIMSESLLLLFAGVDGTAGTMAWCVYYLFKNPKVYQKLVEEIDHVQPVDSEGNVKPYLWCRENLPYLEGVIYETLRIMPPFQSGVSRTVPEGGIEMDGYYIPEKTFVSVNISALQRSEVQFDDATQLKPERWLDRENREIRDKLFTFGKGSRVCIGKHLAWMEIMFCFIGLLTKFHLHDLQPEEKLPTDDETTSFITVKPKSSRISGRLSLKS